MASPVREYRTIVQDSGDPGYVNRVLVGTAVTGLVRVEWVQARYGQLVPPNWSMVQYMHYMDSYMPLRYQVDDAQNLIVKEVVEKDFEWLLLIEHDVILPPDALIKFNQYMREEKHPVVSGLYYTRSLPSEPLVYRGRGTSFYTDWALGEQVWCDGVPTGCLLIHAGILREMWQDAEEYTIRNKTTRRVFQTQRKMWFDPTNAQYNTTGGTSDLDWCKRVIDGDYLAKAGWTEYAGKQYPYLCDTSIFCWHIDNGTGIKYPPPGAFNITETVGNGREKTDYDELY